MLGAGLFLAPTLIRAGATFHDAEADSYLCKEFRNPWRLPKVKKTGSHVRPRFFYFANLKTRFFFSSAVPISSESALSDSSMELPCSVVISLFSTV